jgi:hypothetical protein
MDILGRDHLLAFLLLLLLLSLAPQPSLGPGLLHKIRLNFLEASQQFSFSQGRVVSPTPNPIPEDQASVFISPRGRVALLLLLLLSSSSSSSSSSSKLYTI